MAEEVNTTDQGTETREIRELGGSLVEFALLVALVAVTVISSARSIGTRVDTQLLAAKSEIDGSGGLLPCEEGSPSFPACLFAGP